MFLSIDIGGSKTLLAVFSRCGFCLKRLKFETSPSAEAFLSSLEKNLLTLLPSPRSRARVKAITVAIPGIVRIEADSYSFKFGNLNWPGIDLYTPIKNLFNSSKIFFANDANLATLFEASRPLARHAKKAVYLTFSTGIGGGIAEHGRLTPSSATFEPGHKVYSFHDSPLEWEDFASAKALSEAYALPLSDLPLDKPTIDDLVSRLSIGLADVLKSESPELLIIGGPLGFIINRLKRPLLAALKSSVKLKRASRPTESVIYGAFLYSKQNYRK